MTSMSAKKTIALVEWNWMGHHPTYFRYFSEALLNGGHRIMAICPNPAELRNEMKGISEDLALINEFRKPNLGRFVRVLPRRYHSKWQRKTLFRSIAKRLRFLEKTHCMRVDHVVFACIYDWEFNDFKSLSSSFPYDWSGLYLHCRSMRMPGTLSSTHNVYPDPLSWARHPKCKSIAILDENVVEKFQGFTQRAVVAFPDIANVTSIANHPLGKKIDKFAAGRIVVGCLGYLTPTKGILSLARSKINENKEVVVVIAGEFALGAFSETERREIEQFVIGSENVFSMFQRIPDGPDFNAVVNACDVIAAAYTNFPNSSNILTKAAHFRKPIIVSEGYLMAERVRKFRLGEIVAEGCPNELDLSVRSISADVPGWIQRNKPDWDGFCKRHAIERLSECLTELVTVP